MATRVQDLAAFVADRYDGKAERVWTEATDADDLRGRIGELPGFGEMKIKALGSVLAKRFGVAAANGLVPEPPDPRGRRLGRGAPELPGGEARVQGAS